MLHKTINFSFAHKNTTHKINYHNSYILKIMFKHVIYIKRRLFDRQEAK